MKRILLLMICFSVLFAGVQIKHSQERFNGSMYKSTSFKTALQDNNSSLKVEIRREVTPLQSIHNFSYSSSLEDETTEYSSYANIKKTNTYSRFNYGANVDLYHKDTWSPFLLFQYRSNGNYTREGVGLSYTPLPDKEKWPGKQKISYALIEQSGNLLNSFRHKAEYKGEVFGYKLVYFNISGIESWTSEVGLKIWEDLRLYATYDYDEIIESTYGAVYKVTDELGLTYSYNYTEGDIRDSFGFVIELK